MLHNKDKNHVNFEGLDKLMNSGTVNTLYDVFKGISFTDDGKWGIKKEGWSATQKSLVQLKPKPSDDTQ